MMEESTVSKENAGQFLRGIVFLALPQASKGLPITDETLRGAILCAVRGLYTMRENWQAVSLTMRETNDTFLIRGTQIALDDLQCEGNLFCEVSNDYLVWREIGGPDCWERPSPGTRVETALETLANRVVVAEFLITLAAHPQLWTGHKADSFRAFLAHRLYELLVQNLSPIGIA